MANDSPVINVDEAINELREFPAWVKAVIQETPDDRIVDVLSEVNSVERRLGPLRRTAAAEIPAGATGTEWELEVKREAKRSYNTGGLLHSIGDQLGITNTLTLLMQLIEWKVLKLTWNWSPLKKLMQDKNLDLRRATHEIEDDDPEYDYGEYWQDARPRYIPIEEAK